MKSKDQKFVEWASSIPKAKAELLRFQMFDPTWGMTVDQKSNYDAIQRMKHEVQDKKFRQWMIDSDFLKSLVRIDLNENGLQGIAQRAKEQWSQMVESYDLKNEFNKAFKDACNEYKTYR